MASPLRLQKFLSRCGIASRRKAEEYIAQGRVQIDGKVVTSMGQQITPGKEKVYFDGKEVVAEQHFIYILLNKPKGYVTTLSDPQGRPIVTSLLSEIQERVYPVGRLDLDTEGALLLTNDGDLAQAILHPSHEVTKTYEAEVKGHPGAGAIQRLEKGIVLEEKMTAPAKIQVKRRGKKSSTMIITIHEGRKRQVKKMFQAIGHPVLRLKRLAYGQLTLKGLSTGKYKILQQKDLQKIFSNNFLYKLKNS